MNTVILLLIIYQLKHFIADYPLQGKYMLQKFLPDWSFFFPLLAHTGVHAIMTFCISLCFANIKTAATLAIFDMVVHFTMDRIKAGPKYLGKYKPLTAKEYPTSTVSQKRSNTLFWWSLGLDQMIHHLTHYVIIYVLVTQ
jgi:hypothetical protein